MLYNMQNKKCDDKLAPYDLRRKLFLSIGYIQFQEIYSCIIKGNVQNTISLLGETTGRTQA